MFNVQWVSKVKILNQKIVFFYLEETWLGLELASQSYQWILHEESHTIYILFIQIGKYETLFSKICEW